jgi:hypothetical protein
LAYFIIIKRICKKSKKYANILAYFKKKTSKYKKVCQCIGIIVPYFHCHAISTEPLKL